MNVKAFALQYSVFACSLSFVLTLNLQQPVNSNQEADILSGQPDCSEDQNHRHKPGAGNTGSSNTGHCGGHATREEDHNVWGLNSPKLFSEMTRLHLLWSINWSKKKSKIIVLRYCEDSQVLPSEVWFLVKFSPDSNNLAPIKRNSVHLGDEDGCHSFIKSCAVHVDGGTNREDKTRHSLVNAQVLL